MEKYYVSGCKGQDDDIVTCDDSEAEFWTLYQRMANGTSQGIIDLKFREDAEAAMKVYVEHEALQRKVEASEALMLAMRDDSRESRSKLELVVVESAALKESRKRLGEFILEEIDADYPLNMDVKTPATDAMVNEIRAEGAESVGHALEKIPKREMHISGQRHQYIQRSEALLTAEDIADQLRADTARGGSDDK